MNKNFWIYAFPRTLQNNELNAVNQELSNFVQVWKSHQKATPGEYFSKYQQFFFFHNPYDLSGCSIDSLTHIFKKIKATYDLDVFHQLFFYRDENNNIVATQKYYLKKEIIAGKITKNSIVFNNDITTKEEFINKPWESKLTKSWVFQKYQELFPTLKTTL